MLIEGGYLHSLKKLIEKADAIESGAGPRIIRPAPFPRKPLHEPKRLGASLRAISAKLFRRRTGHA